MDKEIRNRIQRATQEARRLLETEYGEQLAGIYDILPDGKVMPAPGAHLDASGRLLREKLGAVVEHKRAGGMKPNEAVADYLREAAFTTINRFVALKMLEARGLLLESITRGEQSSGFKEFTGLAPALALLDDHGYRLYIESLFDEIGREVGVLFDRHDPVALLWPRRQAMQELLAVLNDDGLSGVWGEDETIGWVYQYFNSDDERRKMRDESAAPRNSRELAVRNQFFTPRYVVQFLTDNTLGRIWYEMRQGNTLLTKTCQYLVQRKHPIFLAPGESPPEPWNQATGFPGDPDLPGEMWTKPNREITGVEELQYFLACYALTSGGYHYAREIMGRDALVIGNEVQERNRQSGKWEGTFEELRIALFCWQRSWRDAQGGMSAEDLVELKSLYEAICDAWDREVDVIPYRPAKDPRDLKILDPACGSGHFLLYAFDLLQAIYEEAWTEEHQYLQSEVTGKTLREDYSDLQTLRAAVPGLILRYNLHGIDIDPRCAQIAALALWMCAQRVYLEENLPRTERPIITRTNIIIAEPMPGEKEMLQEFTASLEPLVLGQMVEAIFDQMKLAGDAGSLLKIEEEISEIIEKAKADLNQQHTTYVSGALPGMESLVKPVQVRFNFSDLPEKDFWEDAERRIVATLNSFAQLNGDGDKFRRRLFADDAARGFAFIDICRKRYDVALMNPPFGDATIATRSYIENRYPDSTHDICAAFVERGLNWLAPGGANGAITTRTCLFIQTFSRWREKILRNHRITCVADLGYGVLDAMVEAAAYIVENKNTSSTTTVLSRRPDGSSSSSDVVNTSFFSVLAESNKVTGLRQKIQTLSGFSHNQNLFLSIPGFSLAYWLPDSLAQRFVSLPSFNKHGGNIRVGAQSGDDFRFYRLAWEIEKRFVKSNESAWIPLAKGGEYSPWWDDPHLVLKWNDAGAEIKSHPSARPQNTNLFFLPGLTYPYRTTSAFGLRCLPSGSAFSVGGWGVFPQPGFTLWDVLAIYNSRVARYFMEVLLGQGDSSVSGSAARNHVVEAVGGIPWPNSGVSLRAQQLIVTIVNLWRANAVDETASGFVPSVIPPNVISISELADIQMCIRLQRLIDMAPISLEVDREVNNLYELTDNELEAIASDEGKHPCEYPIMDLPDEATDEILLSSVVDIIERAQATVGSRRYIVKKAFVLDRAVDLLAHIFRIHPKVILERLCKLGAKKCNLLPELTSAHLSFLYGAAIGRLDIQFATGEKLTPPLPDPFTPLPVCPPGLLQNEQGQPISMEDVERLKKEGRWQYPIEIPFDGILVDDPGHPLDIETRMHQVLEVIWRDRWEFIGREACDILGMHYLREYFRKSDGFFDDHIKRYSKSRRKAPIYWQIATPSSSFSVWLYYHRFTNDTFYNVLNDYVKPKLDYEERRLNQLHQEYGQDANAGQRKEIAEQEAFVDELRAFRDEVARVAPLWNPDLNDGVIINFAPLWRLVPQHRTWQKECKDCWDKLVAGDYDWANLAMHLWPERVVLKCRSDRSLAIAHGLEDVFWEEDAKGKWTARDVARVQTEILIDERTSEAVKAALHDLLTAPMTGGGEKRRRKK